MTRRVPAIPRTPTVLSRSGAAFPANATAQQRQAEAQRRAEHETQDGGSPGAERRADGDLVLALHHRQAPPTTNVTERDPAIDLDVVLDSPRKIADGVALNNSFGFGGHNVAVAFRTV